jgi:hypothetical protein
MARDAEPTKRDKKLSANANQAEVDEFQRACDEADVEPSDTLRKLAKALVLHVRKFGFVSFPIRIEEPRMARGKKPQK